MKSLQVAIISAVVFGSCLTAEAQPPPYLLLGTPPGPAAHRPSYGYYPGSGYEVQTQSYSYGWFGVRPRRHWTRHFGYYRYYTEWSQR